MVPQSVIMCPPVVFAKDVDGRYTVMFNGWLSLSSTFYWYYPFIKDGCPLGTILKARLCPWVDTQPYSFVVSKADFLKLLVLPSAPKSDFLTNWFKCCESYNGFPRAFKAVKIRFCSAFIMFCLIAAENFDPVSLFLDDSLQRSLEAKSVLLKTYEV